MENRIQRIHFLYLRNLIFINISFLSCSDFLQLASPFVQLLVSDIPSQLTALRRGLWFPKSLKLQHPQLVGHLILVRTLQRITPWWLAGGPAARRPSAAFSLIAASYFMISLYFIHVTSLDAVIKSKRGFKWPETCGLRKLWPCWGNRGEQWML